MLSRDLLLGHGVDKPNRRSRRNGHPVNEVETAMNTIWVTARRGSIALAATFLALNLTGSSAAAGVGRNGAASPVAGSSTSVSGSMSQYALVEPSETTRNCANGLLYASSESTCDSVVLVTE
jgi:hypothetical protein